MISVIYYIDTHSRDVIPYCSNACLCTHTHATTPHREAIQRLKAKLDTSMKASRSLKKTAAVLKMWIPKVHLPASILQRNTHLQFVCMSCVMMR